MASDSKVERWCQLISAQDSKFEFNLGIQEGTQWKATPPFPNMKALSSEETLVRRIAVQEISLEVSVPEDDDIAFINVERLVAELEGGREIELARVAKPVEELQAKVDNNICPACDEKIINADDTVKYEGANYHSRCMS